MCAHLIFYYKCADQESILVHENVHLIDAEDGDDALIIATEIGRRQEVLNEDGSLTVDDKPAQYLFAGVRKIITVLQTPETGENGLVSGMEVTYSQFEVDDEASLKKLANGDGVEIYYDEE